MVHKKKGDHHERDHARREEMDFKIMARRNRLFGLWIADKIGLQGDAAEAYAREVVIADLEEVGEEDLFRKVRADLDNHKTVVADAELRKKLSECFEDAKKQLQES
ncbi:MAG: DUF1476 domain-containing protein [Rhodospirillales bacterium]|jgi:hypothetical protein|nr:DUF1476 domain-containing protein [Rhodospirillales bacterium]